TNGMAEPTSKCYDHVCSEECRLRDLQQACKNFLLPSQNKEERKEGPTDELLIK
ncbi:hypothetical protein TNCT_93931, partial [Trichonephila clavata]